MELLTILRSMPVEHLSAILLLVVYSHACGVRVGGGAS